MKNFLYVILVVLLISCCESGINYRFPVKRGDRRITITNEYVLIEVCESSNTMGVPNWKKVSIQGVDSYFNIDHINHQLEIEESFIEKKDTVYIINRDTVFIYLDKLI